MQNNKGKISSGLLHYEDNGIPSKLTFGPKDLRVRLCRYQSSVESTSEGSWERCLSCRSPGDVNVEC